MADAELEVIVVEDHLAVRRGVELMLRDAGFRIAGVAASRDEARAILRRRRFDVALLDVHLGDESSAALVRELLADDPAAPIVLFTGITSGDPSLHDAVTAGARGFVLKASPPQRLTDALRAVAAGGTYVDPALAPILSERDDLSRLGSLTAREREILTLLADGLNGQAIAEQLFLSPETVRTHVRNATAKLGARTRVQAVALVVRGRGGG